jgi:hypothetical protein
MQYECLTVTWVVQRASKSRLTEVTDEPMMEMLGRAGMVEFVVLWRVLFWILTFFLFLDAVRQQSYHLFRAQPRYVVTVVNLFISSHSTSLANTTMVLSNDAESPGT